MRVVSYNILAQAYVKSIFFPTSPAECIKWKKRSREIIRLLTSLNADIMCLQVSRRAGKWADCYFYGEELSKHSQNIISAE